MSHEVCRESTRWIDPVREQARECVRQECDWLCLCCNKWLCSMVWVVVVAGQWVTETVCEVVSNIADAVVGVARAIGSAFVRLCATILNAVTSNAEAINKALGMHVIVHSEREGGPAEDGDIPLIGGNAAKKFASAFNNSDVPENSWYNDSGVRHVYRIDAAGRISVVVDNELERLIQHNPRGDAESEGTLVASAPGPAVGIHFVSKRAGELVRDLTFDLVAASGNRVFVREAGTANFYFTSIKHEFLNSGPLTLGSTVRRGEVLLVPGVYATLDAENGRRLGDFPYNPAIKETYGKHPSLKAFANLSGVGEVIASRLYEGLMVVKVFPGLWHRLDTRPPVNSGTPPAFVETFDHVTYEGALGVRKVEKSIRIHGVLDVGVGHTHRILHYETKYGDEVDTMSRTAYPAIAGPIEDGGGFCDGMCNFYVLCKIKVTPYPFAAPKLTYAILWIDEQTYFCERWRLVGFKDGRWNDLRAWGIAGAYSSFNADSPFFWSPFETSWWSDDEHITDASRLAVAKHTLLVNGRGRIAGLHPDNTAEKLPSPEGNRPSFHPVLYSINFTFATSDRTWRWRGYPCGAAPGDDWGDAQGAICYPETVRIREDMTVYLKGKDESGVRGYWHQKYLPADNTQVPDRNPRAIGMPIHAYMHGWTFARERVFEQADRHSHYGIHQKVDSRSQYYLLQIVDESALPQDFECVPWREADERLFWFYAGSMNYLPSPYNKNGSFFRILDRRPLGYIAVWLDKRDDELPELTRVGGDLQLINAPGGQDDGSTITTSRFERRRKLSPPVVQIAKVALEVREGVVEAFSICFYTRMYDSWDFQSPTPNEPDDGLEWRLDVEDIDIRDYIAAHTPDYTKHDDVASRLTFKPDTTIFRVHITAENDAGLPMVLFDERVHDAFTRRSRYEYLHQWRRHEGGDRHPRERELLEYGTRGNAATRGTSVWFEDITSHVAIAERTIFAS